MHKPLPSLNALRAFEAAARLLSFSKAADELHVTAGALSHLIRGLEETLGVPLFERRVRAVALTAAGKLLYPGLQTGFAQIQDAVAGVTAGDSRVLVISTPPGLTSKWLAPRLYKFSSEHPDIETRISSSSAFANFGTDGVDLAIRNLQLTVPPHATLAAEKLYTLSLIAVCSPRLIARQGAPKRPADVAHFPLIHDETLIDSPEVPTWTDWFRAAKAGKIDLSRGLRFNSADHALDATTEGAGVLLVHDLLAYDDLRSGRLRKLFDITLPSNRAYYLVSPKSRTRVPHVDAFRTWLKRELAAVNWKALE